MSAVSSRVRFGAVLVVVLVAAAVIGRAHGPWVAGGLLAFGLFNAVIAPPGTEVVRLASVLVVAGALVSSDGWWAAIAVIGWLLWPPAYAVAWSLGRRADDPLDKPGADAERARAARVGVAAIVVSVAVASGLYRLLVQHQLQQTSALFVGLPAIIAIVVVLAVSPRTAVGVAVKAVTVGLLISLMFLGEGILCVLMSAPLFYFIAIAIAATMDRAHRNRLSTLRSCAVMLVVAPLSLEGVTGATTFNRDETVSVTRAVHATPDAIACAMAAPPRFDRALPLYLRAGFPRALSTRVDRSGAKPRWIVEMRGGEMHLDGMEPRTGDLVLELEESRPGFVRWRAVSDTSHMTHFLNWQEVIVSWDAPGGVNAFESNVTWTLHYRRGLDPGWYFGPWERYAVGLAAGYLIDAVATP